MGSLFHSTSMQSLSAPSSPVLSIHAPRCSVVVLGGGFAGVAVAHALDHSRSIDVTLVDRKTYFEVCLTTPRFFLCHIDVISLHTRHNRTRQACWRRS